MATSKHSKKKSNWNSSVEKRDLYFSLFSVADEKNHVKMWISLEKLVWTDRAFIIRCIICEK